MFSDQLLPSIGFHITPLVPQLFVLFERQNLLSTCSKIVHDLLIAGPTPITDYVIARIEANLSLGTIVYGPGRSRCSGLNIVQTDDMFNTVDGDEKLEAVECIPISQFGRRDVNETINSVDRKAFASRKSSISLLCITASLFCATLYNQIK